MSLKIGLLTQKERIGFPTNSLQVRIVSFREGDVTTMVLVTSKVVLSNLTAKYRQVNHKLQKLGAGWFQKRIGSFIDRKIGEDELSLTSIVGINQLRLIQKIANWGTDSWNTPIGCEFIPIKICRVLLNMSYG